MSRGASTSYDLKTVERVAQRTIVRISKLFAAALFCGQIDLACAPIIGLAVTDVVMSRALGIRFVGWERFGVMLLFPAVVAGYYRVSGRSDRLADMGYYITLWLVFSVTGGILTYLVARVDFPLRDSEFAHYDGLLDFDWRRWATFVACHRILRGALGLTYFTMLPQTIGSVIYFSHIRRRDRNEELLRTTIVAAMTAIALSAFMPALGPHLTGQRVEWSAVLAAIRAGSVSVFSVDHLQGIIAFPSFHTVGAFLLVYSHRPPLRSFTLVLALNLLMLFSVPSEGQHYLVDIIAGGAVGCGSIIAVNLVNRCQISGKPGQVSH